MLVHAPRHVRCWIVVALAWPLLGCAQAAAPAPQAPPADVISGDSFQVGVLLPGPIDDRSWNQAGYEGVQLIERELGVQVHYRAALPEQQFYDAFREYASSGVDLIIGHGSQFYPAAERVAASYPDVDFAVVGSFPGNNTNLGSIGLRHSEVAYLIGVVAALKSVSGEVAYIGGVDNSSQREALDAIRLGLEATRPEASLSVRWVGDWTDRARAGALARESIAGGADLLIQNADSAGLAVFEAAQEAEVLAIGWAQDQHSLAPGTVVTSAIQRIPVALLHAATIARTGRWEGKQYRLGLSEGAQDLAPFYGLLSPEEEAQVARVRDEILSGSIDTLP
jgi:basic membrane protein A and related proteins